MNPYSPQINPGLTPPQGGVSQRPISLYSPKNIVASSQPVRDRVAETQMRAGELEQQMKDWVQMSANNPLNRLLNQ